VNSFTLSVNVNNTPLGKTWSVDIKDLRLESEAPETLLINSTNSYSFGYTPFGALSKRLHVLVDNVELPYQDLPSTTSGRPNNYTIPA